MYICALGQTYTHAHTHTHSHTQGQSEMLEYTFALLQQHRHEGICMYTWSGRALYCQVQREPFSHLPFVFFQEKHAQKKRKGKKKKKSTYTQRKMSLGLDKKQGGREQWGLGLLLSAERSKTLHSHIEMTARAVRPTRQWKIPLIFQSKLWEHNKDINYKNVNPALDFEHLTWRTWVLLWADSTEWWLSISHKWFTDGCARRGNLEHAEGGLFPKFLCAGQCCAGCLVSFGRDWRVQVVETSKLRA